MLDWLQGVHGRYAFSCMLDITQFCPFATAIYTLCHLSHPFTNDSQPDPGDYTYSGMHDHGPLPPPKEGGDFAQLIGFVNAAKKASDAYLTELIEKEKTAKAMAGSVASAGIISEEHLQRSRKRKGRKELKGTR